MQRPPGPLHPSFTVEFIGDRQGGRIRFDNGAKFWTLTVQLVDSLQVVLGDRTSRLLPRSHGVLQLGNGHLMQLEV